METTHTPGPWKAGTHAHAGEPIVTDANGRPIAFCNADRPTDSANARLIAAAPDLLGALRNLLETSPADVEADEDAWKYRAFVKRVVGAAIAKVEGNA